MTAVRLSAIAFAALALLPATASAATVTVTGDDGNALPINTSAPTSIRQMGVTYTATFDSTDGAFHKTVGPRRSTHHSDNASPCATFRQM